MRVSRRESFNMGAAAVVFAALNRAARAESASDSTAKATKMMPIKAAKESALENVETFEKVHDGLGSVDVRIFSFNDASLPARFLIYDFPPGASEGVHTHRMGDKVEGAFDEYYYIVAGQGEMEIDGSRVPVKAGDHVHTPLTVAHGIKNTHATEHMKVFLTFIDRA